MTVHGTAWVRTLAVAALLVALLVPGPLGPGAARGAGGDDVTLAGTLRAVIAEDVANHRTQTHYYMETARGRVRLITPDGGPPAVASGRRAIVSGTRMADGSVSVESVTDAADAEPSAADPAPATARDETIAVAGAAWSGPSVRRVAVVLGSYTDIPQVTATAAEATEAMTGAGASVRTFFETASRGRTTVQATVLGPWDLGIDSCDGFDAFTATLEAVERKAASAGVNLSTFDHVIIWTRPPCGSGWTAVGEVPGRYIHLSAEYPDTGTGREYEFAAAASHEMGHNMGMFHANALRCEVAGVPVPLGTTCASVEYGDPYSAMGGDLGYLDTTPAPDVYRFLSPLFGAAELDHLGWLAPGEVATATSAGTYDLVPTYGPDAGARLLRIRRVPAIRTTDPHTGLPMRSGWWTVELRSVPPAGPWDAFGADVAARSGVILRYVEDGFDYSGAGWAPVLGSSFLVDMDPDTAGVEPDDAALLDAPLEVGETFTDPLTGTQITLASLDAAGASVAVALPGGPPPAAPVRGAAAITSVVPETGRVTVGWTAPATAGSYPPDGYTVRSYPGLESCTVAPAQPGPGSCTVTNLANGTAYRFVVTYETGNGYWVSSAPSGPVSPIPPPVASITPLAAYRTTPTIGVAWSGSDRGGPVDSFDVQYRVARWDGTFGAYTRWRSLTTTTSGTLTASSGRTYCFSARSRAGTRVGAWTAETCTAVPLDDRSLSRSGGWTAGTSAAYYRSTALRASRTKSSLTRTKVVAKRIALVVSTCPTCGSVKVYWNGSYKKTISLRSSTTRNKVLVSALSFSSVRSGTLKLVVSSSSKRVVVDGVAINRR